MIPTLIYQRSFEQLKALSIVALIIVHSVSFVNDYHKFRFDLWEGIHLLVVLGFFHVLFLLMAGISFRFNQQQSMQNGRMKSPLNLIWVVYFFILMSMENLKALIVWDGMSFFLVWDFLKTIFFSFALITVFTRVHIALTVTLSLILTFSYDFLSTFLRSFEVIHKLSEVNLVKWSTFHVYLLVVYSGLYLVMVWITWRSCIAQKLKIALSILLFAIFSVVCTKVLKVIPSLYEFQTAQNWWIWSLVGSSQKTTLFPLLSWFQTITFGFALTHIVLINKGFFMRVSAKKWFLISVLLFLGPCYAMIGTEQLGETSKKLWHIEALSRSTPLGELFKISFFLMCLSFLAVLNTKFDFSKMDLLLRKVSFSVFWIYLLSTSWPVFLSKILAKNALGLVESISIVTISTLVLSVLLAHIVYSLGQKKIKIRLVRH